jgi:hypothetical protein
MSTSKQPATFKKPKNIGAAAAAFADRQQEPSKASSSEKTGDTLSSSQETASRAGKSPTYVTPEGDMRLNANIRKDLHLKLKMEAAQRGTTIGEIIESLVEQYL